MQPCKILFNIGKLKKKTPIRMKRPILSMECYHESELKSRWSDLTPAKVSYDKKESYTRGKSR